MTHLGLVRKAVTFISLVSLFMGTQGDGVAVKANEQEYVLFDHFTSESYTSQLKGHGQYSRLVVFDMNHWYSENAYVNDASYSYTFYNGKDYKGVCERVGDHNNCFVLPSSGWMFELVEKIPKGAPLVDCPKIHEPVLGGTKRELKQCYHVHYHFDYPREDQFTDYIITDLWIEDNTNYPVRRVVHNKRYEKKEGKEVFFSENKTIKDYCTFDPDMPKDRTKLSPLPGVKVYDFRTGKEGLFTESFSLQGTVLSQEMKDEIIQNATQRKGFNTLNDMDKFISFAGPSFGPAPVHTLTSRDAIPASFDAREHWPKCTVIKRITDQTPCGSCWAMASSGVLADRVCISTNGEKNTPLSPQFMVNCFTNQNGCSGGNGEPTWKDLIEIGTVPESCVKFKGIDDTCTGTCNDGTPMPKATKAKSLYSPWGETDQARVEAIQREIMEHGPVTASYWAFSDFQPHQWSVYHRSKTATFKSGHVVRIIGWGTENKEDYWLIANSWGTGWGEDGFFKMRRGNNECNIEEMVIAGEPLTE